MKQRKLAFVIILGLITLGIYDIYWLLTTRKEMIAKGHSLPSLWRAILYPILGIVAGIVIVVAGAGKNSAIINILSILVIFGGLIAAIVFGIRFLAAYCRVAEQITNHDVTYSYGFWLGMLLYLFRVGFIWEAIMQYHFNRIGMVPAGAAPAVPLQPMPMQAQGRLSPDQAVQPAVAPQPMQFNNQVPQAQVPPQPPAGSPEPANQQQYPPPTPPAAAP